MRIVFLNMDRRADRRAWMEKQAAAMGLRFERFPAIDGNDLAHNPVRSLGISEGAYACFLGHRAMWKDIAERDDPFTVVLEDDVHFGTGAADFLRDDDWIPQDADLIHLEWERSRVLLWNGSRKKAGRRALYRLAGECAGAAAYVISRRCARTLTAELHRIDVEFDHILFSRDYVNSHNVLKLVPALAIQDARQNVNDFGSDNRSNSLHFGNVQQDDVKPELTAIQKLRREQKRIFRQATDLAMELAGPEVVISKAVKFK